MPETTVDAPPRLYLSPPVVGELERAYVQEAFDTNWIAPVGPHVDAFEREFADAVGAEHAVALSSGTAALHLAMRMLGIADGDRVLVSSLTFCASVNPILYERATPVFVDAERRSWNLDPNLVEDAVREADAAGRPFKALMVVHLYGQTADLDALGEICERYGVPMIEDAAEALGATYKGRAPGTDGVVGAFSFNGNKIITTSGGGMLVTGSAEHARHAKKLSTQAREAAPHYEHTEIGFNYRLSNVLAGIGRGQLTTLGDRVASRRATFAAYQDGLGDLAGIGWMPEAPWGTCSRWLSCLTIDPAVAPTDREAVRLALEAENIEARPVWKPMHLQPVYDRYACVGGAVSEELFAHGLCLPSGSDLTDADRARVIETVRAQWA